MALLDRRLLKSSRSAFFLDTPVGERGAKEAPLFLFLKYLFNKKQQTHNYDSANRFMLNVHYPTEIVTLIILISKLISIEL